MRISNIPILLLMVLSSSAFSKQLTIYHDADYSGHASSAESMAMGLKTALSEVDFKIQGFEIKLVAKDHRGNVKRSKLHMKQFNEDPNALFVLGGLHSPPYLANKNYINKNGILVLIPWAAAGPITRTTDEKNWFFRLSIDDSKAGYRLARHAVDEQGCQSPHLLLENTGWGKSNLNTITLSLQKKGIKESGVTWFEWNTKTNTAKQMLYDVIQKKSDCIMFVGNAIEGSVFTRALATFPESQRIPIISHWGLTGGNFHEIYVSDLHNQIDLSFLQTCFTFNSGNLNGHAQQVFYQAKSLFGNAISKPEDIKAPPGFIHSYDMGKVLLAALEQVTLSGDVKKDRESLRIALENIRRPVQGLVKTYNPPFSPWGSGRPDAHEALGLESFCMAQYDEQGVIRLK